MKPKTIVAREQREEWRRGRLQRAREQVLREMGIEDAPEHKEKKNEVLRAREEFLEKKESTAKKRAESVERRREGEERARRRRGEREAAKKRLDRRTRKGQILMAHRVNLVFDRLTRNKQ